MKISFYRLSLRLFLVGVELLFTYRNCTFTFSMTYDKLYIHPALFCFEVVCSDYKYLLVGCLGFPLSWFRRRLAEAWSCVPVWCVRLTRFQLVGACVMCAHHTCIYVSFMSYRLACIMLGIFNNCSLVSCGLSCILVPIVKRFSVRILSCSCILCILVTIYLFVLFQVGQGSYKSDDNLHLMCRSIISWSFLVFNYILLCVHSVCMGVFMCPSV